MEYDDEEAVEYLNFCDSQALEPGSIEADLWWQNKLEDDAERLAICWLRFLTEK